MIPRNDLIQVVYEDLQYLREEWNHDVEDATLRRESTVLRRLLVQNELQRAWKLVGLSSQPIIKAPSLEPLLNKVALGDIELGTAGGATYGKVTVERTLVFSRALSMQEIDSLATITPSEIGIKLSDFIRSACMVVCGHRAGFGKLDRGISGNLA